MMGEMRKFMAFASALALSGSMTLAMEEDAMDEMMEAPAPSVVVGGSGKIGIRNVDDGDEATEDFKLVRAYKVTFDSTGTTDGGLMFGAGMSIRDDTTETKDGGPVVRGSYVFVGGGNGSWKLQFGGNDPGIDLAGGFGVADDHLGGGNDATIALSGSFGNTSFRITAADPGIEVPVRTVNFVLPANHAARDAYAAVADRDNDWSIGVSHSIDTINVGVGMDSEDGLAIGVGTDLSGVSTFVYWSKSEYRNKVFSYANVGNDWLVNQDNTGLGIKTSISAGEGATFSVGYSTLKVEQVTTTETDQPNFANIATGNAKSKLIEVDFTYDLGGGATLEAGIDKKDGETLTLGAAGPNATANVVQSDETTLQAAISFSF